ncbi:PIN domain-containing protein [Rubrivirga sp. S365]|uniref:PIN domain-containing protein n=1 Tax=Rubrivirga sp. S365 TaxID=3076080 RepID=UPI0028C5A883|nr:PIN domain-containing protein [Rubrivirga sp. S365]MDT7858258.1 PIN domain-containing protein [Rubrivirga sp. S365]
MRLALLDANVLYGAFSRDVLLRLAAAGLYRPRWTDRIEAEWVGALLAARPDLAPERLARTRAAMARAFPDAAVSGYEGREDDLQLPDPDDRHVLAAAVEAQVGEVVTWNLSDFPAAVLAPLGVEAASPDAFVGSMLEEDPDRVVAAMRAHRAGLHRPPLTTGQYLGHLERAGLVRVVAALVERTDDL